MGGRKIDDHSFWAGKGNDMNVCPKESKQMKMEDVNGCGDLMRYEDKQERIKEAQQTTVKKVKSHPMKPGYRY